MPTFSTEDQLLAYLDAQGIPYIRTEHPPVFTCEQADLYRPPMPAVHTKNLFLRDRHASRFYLLMTACAKRVDMKAVGQSLGVSKLHFASEQQLFDVLGLSPGAVTVLAVANDAALQVQLLIDAEIWNEDNFLCHPLVNTATLLLARPQLWRFFALTGHEPQAIEVPTRE